MKNVLNDTFLEKYKQLEVILRKHNPDGSVLQYEETLQTEDMEKLRICRQIRNFMQHHHDGQEFLQATDTMNRFIDDIIIQEISKDELASDRMTRLSPLSVDMKLGDVIARFAKTAREWLPITNVDGIFLGCLTAIQLLQKIPENRNITKIEKLFAERDYKKYKVYLCDKNSPLSELAGKDVVVINENRKYLGIIKW